MPAGFAALAAIPNLGLFQILISIGWWELKGWKQVEGSTPGDFGIPYLKYLKNDDERASKRAIELNNGRAAQMGILAIMIHEKLDGHPYVYLYIIRQDIRYLHPQMRSVRFESRVMPVQRFHHSVLFCVSADQ